MGQIANIVDYQGTKRAATTRGPAALSSVSPSALARLIPGSSGTAYEGHSIPVLQVPFADSRVVQPSIWIRLAGELSPRCLLSFKPRMMAAAALDLGLTSVIFLAQEQVFAGLNLVVTCAYILAFLIFAIPEGLYSQKHSTGLSEAGAVLRVLTWATLFGGFAAISWRLVPALITFTVGNACALMLARCCRRKLKASDDCIRNVLIIGSGKSAQQIANAIHEDRNSRRRAKGFMAESHLRNIYGPEMLARISREEFVDEIVIASADESVAQIAIREAQRNRLDVKLLPLAWISPLRRQVEFETVGGIPLLSVEDHKQPEVSLALKRLFDVTGALCSMAALLPAFLLIAMLIKLDSAGAIFYRAPRVGSRGRKFTCYKFRTMVTGADAIKDGLRSRNERHGAFFKMENDPRVTRLGRFLRKYSLDELPQLWNVVRGEMSLVGPRPHPPDDVDLYELQHLQRLDFVPGITGLWQTTARRDPSFERSVSLDVEYIKRWNLWLDLKILCRTVSIVLAGSGA
ncbi:MAG TPA: sugar transferase [Terriglobales bacterium]|jgi:exopolysaccharide biosynthesis polyprenyl glycosylphosphotransferase